MHAPACARAPNPPQPFGQRSEAGSASRRREWHSQREPARNLAVENLRSLKLTLPRQALVKAEAIKI